MKAFAFALALCSRAPRAAAPRTETAVLAGGCFWGMESRIRACEGREATSYPAMPAEVRGTRTTTR